MSVLLPFKVACPKCLVSPGARCRVATGKRAGAEIDTFHEARQQSASNRFRVALYHCPLHGLTTETHEAYDYSTPTQPDGYRPPPLVECCAVSVASTPDAESCDQPVTGPFYATLDEPRPS